MTIDQMTKAEFSAELLGHLKDDPFLRPLVCRGHPFDCSIFVVGFNAAHRLSDKFSAYWNPCQGFKKDEFLCDYRANAKRRGSLGGARKRIEWIADIVGQERLLDTNIYAYATEKKKQIPKRHRITHIFEFLFEAVSPRSVFVHSNDPIAFFRDKIDCTAFSKCHLSPQRAFWRGRERSFEFELLCRPGPLWRAGKEEVEAIGYMLAESTLWR